MRGQKVCEFSSQILLPQRTGWEERQHRGTIRKIFEVRMEAFLKNTSCFFDKWSVHFMALRMLNRFRYIAAEYTI